MIFSSCHAVMRDPSSDLRNSSWMGNCLMRFSGKFFVPLGDEVSEVTCGASSLVFSASVRASIMMLSS